MQPIVLKAASRESGTGAARQVRREGGIPAVLYGHGVDGLPIRVIARELERVLISAGRHGLVSLQLPGETHAAMIKDLQHDRARATLLHVDFFRVDMKEKVRTSVVIVVRGGEAVHKAGGVLEHQLHEVEVECLPGDIPDHLEVDASQLEIGAHLSVGDLKLPSGVTVLNDPTETILVVGRPQSEEAAEAPTPAAEPEVIGKGKADEDEDKAEEKGGAG